ncbi:hypothetical protein CEE39_00855 [bacterium (candidate division B38) B3_B38]|nr:MAG: hypothetical protein CEE39_00855 [bacterium (candidate division B38) B3_B38]
MKIEAERWWKQAESDLETAEFNLNGRRLSAAAFYIQQSVEKALKALYLEMFSELLKTHNIVFLAGKLNLPENLIKICDNINPIYTATRYPDSAEFIPEENLFEEDLKMMLEGAQEILKWIKKRL